MIDTKILTSGQLCHYMKYPRSRTDRLPRDPLITILNLTDVRDKGLPDALVISSLHVTGFKRCILGCNSSEFGRTREGHYFATRCAFRWICTGKSFGQFAIEADKQQPAIGTARRYRVAGTLHGEADLQETWIADRRRGRSIGRDNGRFVGRRGLRIDFFLLWYPGETRNNGHARWHFRINQWGGWHGGRRGNRKRPMGGNPRLENQQD